jgi:hypothetical protein
LKEIVGQQRQAEKAGFCPQPWWHNRHHKEKSEIPPNLLTLVRQKAVP